MPVVRTVIEDSISHISAIRSELAKIGQATMLLAPRASAVLYSIETQLDELQTIVERMADNSVRLLLDRPESDWDYSNPTVLTYQAGSLKRATGAVERHVEWSTPQYVHGSPLCRTVWEGKHLTIFVRKVFPDLQINKVLIPFSEDLTGRAVVERVMDGVRKKMSRDNDADLSKTLDVGRYLLGIPGTNEYVHQRQNVLTSESVREALSNQKDVCVSLYRITRKKPDRKEDVKAKQEIQQFKARVNSRVVVANLKLDYKSVRSIEKKPGSIREMMGYEACAVNTLRIPFRIRILGVEDCTKDTLPLLDGMITGLYVRTFLSSDNKILGMEHPVLDDCTNVCPLNEQPRFKNEKLPRSGQALTYYSEIPVETRLCLVLYGTKVKDAHTKYKPNPQQDTDMILGYVTVPMYSEDQTFLRGRHSFGLWPSVGIKKSGDAKASKHANVLWFYGSNPPFPNRDEKKGVARLYVEFPELEIPIYTPVKMKTRMGRASMFTRRAMDAKSFTVRIISCANLAPKDASGLGDPYVKVYAKASDQPRLTKLGKTPVKRKTLNPSWAKDGKQAQFQGVGSKLVIEVWDKGFWSGNDFMGRIEVGLLEQKFFDLEPGKPLLITRKCMPRTKDIVGISTVLGSTPSRKRDDAVSGTITFEYTINVPDNIKKLDRLIAKDLMHEYSEADYNLLWNCRAALIHKPEVLPKLLRSVNWSESHDANEFAKLLRLFKTPKMKSSAMMLLGPMYTQKIVRSYAVGVLDTMRDDELALYMLQLVQCLKYEAHHSSELSRMLIRRGLQSPYQVGHKLFWTMKAEMAFAPEFMERYQVILEEYLMRAGKHREELAKQYIVCKRFEEVSHQVTLARRTKKKKVVDAMYYKMLNVINDQLLKRIGKFQLPLDPKVELTTLIVHKCKYMSSKMVPLWLVFNNADPSAPPYKLIFKTGDDLRQDILTLQMLEVMNQIWMKNGLDMNLKIYKVIATGVNRYGAGVGLVQVVENASTTSDIQRDYGGGASGAFDASVISKYLAEHDQYWKGRSKRNFTYSCAGYCVATLVLGIGDRHSSNIMCTKDGHLFHIDFGHFLGNFKSKFGVKRERTPFVFTPEMAQVISDGKHKSRDYKEFLELCKKAYNLVRKHADLLEMLFILMTSAGMPELMEVEDIQYLRQQLNLQMSEKDADKHLETLIERSRANMYKRLDNYIHNWRHGG